LPDSRAIFWPSSEIFGVMAFLSYFGTTFFTQFGRINIYAALANNLFQDKMTEDSTDKDPGHPVKPDPRKGRGEIKLPSFLSVRILFSWCCGGCCCKRGCRRMWLGGDFDLQTRGLKEEVDYSLDIARYIRRIRMHGLALMLLMDDEHTKVSGMLGEKRDVKFVQEEFDAKFK